MIGLNFSRKPPQSCRKTPWQNCYKEGLIRKFKELPSPSRVFFRTFVRLLFVLVSSWNSRALKIGSFLLTIEEIGGSWKCMLKDTSHFQTNLIFIVASMLIGNYFLSFLKIWQFYMYEMRTSSFYNFTDFISDLLRFINVREYH